MTPHDAIQTTLTPLDGVESARVVTDFIGDAELALLGEASHGTHEFYASRANITKQLMLESGFRAVVVEADWPDAYRVNRYVRHESRDTSAINALEDFKRFPTWMWRNTDVVAFVEWLRGHNEGLPPEQQAGFYGMDLYALHASMRAVLAYLDKTDLEAARRACDRYGCFDRYGEDPQTYAYAETFGLESREDAVIDELKRVRPALTDSYEQLFHEIPSPRFFLSLHDEPVRHVLMKSRLERAIGVIYRPDTERQSHYFHASLSSQFDAVLHFDHASAVRPLEVTARRALPEVPETFPSGV